MAPRTLTPLVAGDWVYLRAPSVDDTDEFLEMNRRSLSFYRSVGRPMLDRQRFEAYVARCDQPNFVGLFVCRRTDDALVGCVNLSDLIRGQFHSAYMGYQVFAPYARQGYMTAAMPLVLRRIFTSLKLHRVEANIQPTNTASLALARRAGFEREGYSPRYLKIGGRWRDHERWAITRERFREVLQARRATR